MTILVSGSLQEGFSRYVFDAHRGHAIIKPPDAVHWDRAGNRGAICLVLELTGQIADHLTTRSLLERCEVRRLGVEQSALERASELVHEGGIADAELDDLAFTVLGELKQRDGHAAPSWLRQVHEYVADRYASSPSVEEIAQIVGVHPVYLARVFRAHHGCSVRTYIANWRVHQAADRLRESRRPLSEVAISSGFSDQSHMTRAFQTHFGVSPGRLRRQDER